MLRKQLNTDIMLHLLTAVTLNNVLLLANTKLSRADASEMKKAINDFSDKTNKLSDKSIVLDKEENSCSAD